MTLIEQIKKDQLVARKDRNPPLASLLTTLIGEAEMVGKNVRNGAPTDKEVHATITKFMKGNAEIMNLFKKGEAKYIVAEFENDILFAYRPQHLSQDELKAAVVQCAEEIDAQSPKQMGAVMKQLREKFSDRYDGRAASGFVRDYLNEL